MKMNESEERDLRAARGRVAGAGSEEKKLVRLDDDVARAFPDSEAVNKALRAVLQREAPSDPLTN